MKKKSYVFVMFYVIIAIVIFSGYMIINMTNNNNSPLNKMNEGIYEWNSLAELQEYIENNQLNIKIPSIVTHSKDLKIKQDILTNKFTVYNSEFVFKVLHLNNSDEMSGIDVMEIGSESEEDRYLEVKRGGEVESRVRIRRGNTEYSKCIILNWVHGEYAYGIMIEKEIEDSKLLEEVGIFEGCKLGKEIKEKER